MLDNSGTSLRILDPPFSSPSFKRSFKRELSNRGIGDVMSDGPMFLSKGQSKRDMLSGDISSINAVSGFQSHMRGLALTTIACRVW